MDKVIKIGTRESELALWQATLVQKKMDELGLDSQLTPIKSDGDVVLDKPLYELGITGIFTKNLDVALIKGDIDIAVHSLKDVPTLLPKGIVQVAVLERADATDVLVHKGLDLLEQQGTIATGSLRRKAQWLNQYPNHSVVDLRGNVNSRLIKVIQNDWHGAIFAKAGLERIKLLPKDALELDWMIPAPAQGAIQVAALEKNTALIEMVSKLDHSESALCTAIERDFLRTLEGGCTAPIGAHAQIKNQSVYFKAGVFMLDGSKQVVIEKEVDKSKSDGFGKKCALEVLSLGGAEIMQSIKDANSTFH